jgi:hypothetical protein
VQVVLCGDMVINTEIVEFFIENVKHLQVKTIATSRAKKLKSGMGVSKSLSWRGLKFPI